MSSAGPPSPATESASPSTAALLHDLSTQVSRLIADEMKLARKEFQLSAKRAGQGAGMAGAAGLLAVLGSATAVAAVVAALSTVLAVWASAAIVAVVLLAAAGVALAVSKKQLQRIPEPAEESAASVRLDVETIKEARHGDS